MAIAATISLATHRMTARNFPIMPDRPQYSGAGMDFTTSRVARIPTTEEALQKLAERGRVRDHSVPGALVTILHHEDTTLEG
ncbi:hypothetical protein CONPUDRAFT_83796 [Coniophora puteana RWD-64-598 SS2]|uniref:Uncharacterized protein n=1 Tax=Coniophora puteana (strain RWD-64-598) TaxID=741705 RepID=A0A5M3MI83_CONPW|nr:uncharacterized protein CONPUDRAFT_83796 [Coniophora puteana RWD-64-598 SS2]EIW78355.1 hypothetical protein CONPUDRAFT_83796 [Coniophora puteana RWD-64-598 SS2]